MAENGNTLWVTGYHPLTGQKVSITFALDAADPIASANAWLARLGELHIAVNPPTGDERIEDITRVVRRHFTTKKGKAAEVVDFYTENLEYKLFTIYIDTDEDKAAFEAGTGVAYDKLKPYSAVSAMGRDQDPNFVHMHKLSAPAKARMIPNPDYDPSKASAIERGAQRIFSEWLNAPKSTPPPAASGNGTPPATQQTDMLGVDEQVGKAVKAGVDPAKWGVPEMKYFQNLCGDKQLDVRKTLKLTDGQTGSDYKGTLADAIALWAAYGTQEAAA